MNKFQRKMFIGAMFEWFALLLLFIVGLIMEIVNFNSVILTIKEANSYGKLEVFIITVMAISPLIAIPLILTKVIIPCYKGIMKGEIW